MHDQADVGRGRGVLGAVLDQVRVDDRVEACSMSATGALHAEPGGRTGSSRRCCSCGGTCHCRSLGVSARHRGMARDDIPSRAVLEQELVVAATTRLEGLEGHDCARWWCWADEAGLRAAILVCMSVPCKWQKLL